MKLQRINTAIVPTSFTLSTLVLNSHQANLLAPLTNRIDHVGAAITVFPLFNYHNLTRVSRARLQSPALPTELQGNKE
jgi:hypothetical protein